MEYIVNALEMKQYDKNTTEYFHMESMILMERAAMETVKIVAACQKPPCKVLVVAGSGNNGGDGFAVGRILSERNYQVTFVFLGDLESASSQTQKQIDILSKYKANIKSNIPEDEYDIVIDSIFGIGLSRNITGTIALAIDKINSIKGIKIALDIPSGIDASTGEVLGCAVKADITVTFAFKKRGQLYRQGVEYCGQIICVNIGITRDSFLNQTPEMFSYNVEDLALLPRRNRQSHKGDFGKVLVIAGSEDMSGACMLVVKSIYRCGAGVVKVITPNENREIMQRSIPEAILMCYDVGCTDDKGLEQQLIKEIEWATVITIGSGLSINTTTANILKTVLQYGKVPVIIDADGINMIAADRKLLSYERKAPIILTPHIGELKRLLQGDIGTTLTERIARIQIFTKEYQVIVVSKDATTFVYNEMGGESAVYCNQSGNEALATAGSGDVLAGIITGLTAQNMDPFEAACLGVYLHGLAGEEACKHSNSYYVMAHDIIKQLKYMMCR